MPSVGRVARRCTGVEIQHLSHESPGIPLIDPSLGDTLETVPVTRPLDETKQTELKDASKTSSIPDMPDRKAAGEHLIEIRNTYA